MAMMSRYGRGGGSLGSGGGGGGPDSTDEEEDDFVALLPPPAEKYDPDWRLKSPDYPPRCPHCKNWIGNQSSEDKPVQQHILNGCRTFQNQGRYGWRHTALLHFIDSLMDRKNLRVYSDLPERRTEWDGTVPDQLLGPKFDQFKHLSGPDMVFFSKSFDDESTFSVGVVEVSVPWDVRVEAARAEKQQENAVLLEALTTQTRTPVLFLSLEIGSYQQRLSEGSKASMRELYSFTDQSIPYKAFRSRIVKLAELASFQLYSTRFESAWPSFSPYLELPPSMLSSEDNISSESGEAMSVGEPAIATSSSNPADLPSQPPPPQPTIDLAIQEEEEEQELKVDDVVDVSDQVDQCSQFSAENEPIQPPEVGSRVSEIEAPEESVSAAAVDGAAETEVVAFGVRTKLVIYGSVTAAILYVIYNYWHVILTGLFCLLVYEIWDKLGHTLRKDSKRND